MLTQLAEKLQHSALSRHLLFLSATFLTILLIGYNFGTFDEAMHIPFLKSTADPTLYPGDTMIELHGISDVALDRVAQIVRGADTARLDLAPQAAGLLAISLGNSVLAGADDHDALARGMAVYDALYAWARFAAEETHNWPSKKG